ncbi:hypothetical protein D3C74_374350 [compost metagenome]
MCSFIRLDSPFFRAAEQPGLGNGESQFAGPGNELALVMQSGQRLPFCGKHTAAADSVKTGRYIKNLLAQRNQHINVQFFYQLCQQINISFRVVPWRRGAKASFHSRRNAAQMVFGAFCGIHPVARSPQQPGELQSHRCPSAGDEHVHRRTVGRISNQESGLPVTGRLQFQ